MDSLNILFLKKVIQMISTVESYSPEQKREVFETLYKRLLIEGIKAFNTEDDFSEACHVLLKLCLSVNDYINANNVLQCYKSDIKRNRNAWYHYYSIIVHGKRYPSYFLNNPEHLVKKIDRYAKSESDQSLSIVLINLLYFYIKLYDNYRDVFKEKLVYFSDYFLNTPLDDFTKFNNGIEQLSALLKEKIDFEDIDFDLKEIVVKEKEIDKEEEETNDVVIYNKDPKVLVIGALSLGKDKVYGIAKKIGFKKQQIEILQDFNVIKTYDISKIRNNPNYCGIIFGPVPHSSKSMNSDTSLITHVENNEGYPPSMRSEANGSLKITKSSIERTLSEIYSHYMLTKE